MLCPMHPLSGTNHRSTGGKRLASRESGGPCSDREVREPKPPAPRGDRQAGKASGKGSRTTQNGTPASRDPEVPAKESTALRSMGSERRSGGKKEQRAQNHDRRDGGTHHGVQSLVRRSKAYRPVCPKLLHLLFKGLDIDGRLDRIARVLEKSNGLVKLLVQTHIDAVPVGG